MDKEKDIYDVVYNVVAELDSYNALFSAYIEQHEDIPEMLHLNLISIKMQEQIDILKDFSKKVT